MNKYKVGEIVEIVWSHKVWSGKRKVTKIGLRGVSIYSKEMGCNGWFPFNKVKKVRIENWRERII